MVSNYRKYVEEQLPNRFVYENEYGFLTYNINEEVCQLEEIYIKPEYRRQGKASEFYERMEELAIEKNCNTLLGSIIIGTNNAEGSMKCLFKNGFTLSHTKDIVIFLTKKIGG